MKKKGFIIISVLLILITLTSFTNPISALKDYALKVKVAFDLYNTINENYVDKIEPDDLGQKIIDGMLEMLDPHSVYMPPRNNERFRDNMAGYAGIGVSFRVINEKITIFEVFKEGPSGEAGIRPGDRIVGINGESSIGILQDDVPKKLKGPQGTKVNVTIERTGLKEPMEFTIIRDFIVPPSLEAAYMIDEETGYISLDKFNRTTGQETHRAVNELLNKGMKKLILDLSGNAGGYLQAAVDVASEFIERGKMIVYTKGRKSSSNTEYSSYGHSNPLFPVVILIDHASASSSEIVAGAVQDWDRGVIVGTRSFGKALVQSLFPFDDGSSLLLTIAKYYTPSGRLIQREYKDKTLEQYYRESRNDSLLTALDEGGEQPEFNTKGGRTIFGGGGITPDYKFDFEYIWDDSIKTFAFRMWRDRHTFLYINENIDKFENIDLNPLDFAKNYKISDDLVENFKPYLKKNNIEFTDEVIQKNIFGLKLYFKAEIANFLWNSNGRKMVFNNISKFYRKSMEYFDEAEDILDIYKKNLATN